MAFDRSYSADLTIGELELIIKYSADEDGLEIDSVHRIVKEDGRTVTRRDRHSEVEYQDAIWVAVQKDYKDMLDPETFQ